MKFDPDWTVAPGETLREWREDHGHTGPGMATLCGLPVGVYWGIELGDEKITHKIARRLAMATGIRVEFWMAYEDRYRADLAAGRKFSPTTRREAQE